MKQCTKCKELKASDSFYRDTRRKDGLQYWCKECDRLARYQGKQCTECNKPVTNKNLSGLCLSCGKKGERHHLFGKPRLQGEKHYAWKGDKVGYGALHDWVRSRLVAPKKCQHCGEEKKLDLANKTGQYLRDLDDWLWLCRSCHRQYDGVLKGESHANSKLTELDVIDIYNSPLRGAPLSERYKISQANISLIKNGLAWRHLNLSIWTI